MAPLDHRDITDTDETPQVLGAWNEHRPVLERLGVPACHSTLPLAALDERNRSHPLARPQVLVDVVHLSRWGHLLTAFFCVAVLHAEGEALWRHSAAQREARWRASLALPRASSQSAVAPTRPLAGMDGGRSLHARVPTGHPGAGPVG